MIRIDALEGANIDVLSLDSSRWDTLADAYGPASMMREMLLDLTEASQDRYDLYGRLCHQGTAYTASYAAVPHLLISQSKSAGASAPTTQTYPTQLFAYTRTDGFDVGLGTGLTISGVRAQDNAAGKWTTPDAYTGDVHDPMSQKSFMWNNNNPYVYGDPSGYDALMVTDPTQAFHLGHERMVIYDPKTNTGTEYSQGPNHNGMPIDLEVITKTAIKDVTGYIHAQHVAGQAVHKEVTTSSQDRAMYAKADERKAMADTSTMLYTAFDNNCAVFVGDVLTAGKLPVAVHVGGVPNLNGYILQSDNTRK
jgi:hypothetical protein